MHGLLAEVLNIVIQLIRKGPSSNKDLSVQRCSSRAAVELLKMKTLEHVMNRFPLWKDDLCIFLAPWQGHIQHHTGSSTEANVDDSGNAGDASPAGEILTSHILPALPKFEIRAKSSVWRLMAEMMPLTGQSYNQFTNCTKNTNSVGAAPMTNNQLAMIWTR